jgi:uncharacterized protein YbcI
VGRPPGPAMIETSRNTAELEYAVMLAVLNFQSQFLKSCYRQARVQVRNHEIEVTLTKTTTIPAEESLAQTADGRELLEQVHGELFRSGEALLRGEIERVLNAKVGPITSRLDAAAGITTITIHLQETVKG